MNTIKLQLLPAITHKEIAVLEKVKTKYEKGERYFPYEITNYEMMLIGSAMAKAHLKEIVTYIKSVEAKSFTIDFFSYTLRLFVAGQKKPTMVLGNQLVGSMTMYKAGYAKIIDEYFNEPIVEKSYQVFTRPFRFTVEK